jgi:hypothetical protein
MGLIKEISERKILAEFQVGEQPGATKAPHTIEHQISGNTGINTEENIRQVKMYRAYKKRMKKEEGDTDSSKSSPILPKVLKNKLSVQQHFRKDEIAPSI